MAKWGEAYEHTDSSDDSSTIHLEAIWDNLPPPDENVRPWLMIYLYISMASALTFKRADVTRVFGGNPHSVYTTTACGRALLFSTLKMNPWLPSAPGGPGLLLRATARGHQWAGAGVQAIGITAEGFFSAPDAPPVPELPSQQAGR